MGAEIRKSLNLVTVAAALAVLAVPASDVVFVTLLAVGLASSTLNLARSIEVHTMAGIVVHGGLLLTFGSVAATIARPM